MRLTFIGILALAANAFAGTIAQAEDASPSVDYHYGEIADPSLWPTSAVGAITVLLSSVHRATCTGTLVARNLVLTAAHCLFNSKELVKPGNVRFLAGLNKGVPAAYSVAECFVISKEYAPGPWTSATAATDWAVIVLVNALLIRPVSVKTLTREQFRAASKSGYVTQIGYGMERPYLPSIVRNCRVSEALAEAFPLVARAARAGFADAEFWVAQSYLEGSGVPASRPEGVRWLKRAAAHGSVDAQALLSSLYLQGLASEVSAEATNSAQSAQLFASDAPTAPDFEAAATWARRAAGAGSAQGQALLGYILRAVRN